MNLQKDEPSKKEELRKKLFKHILAHEHSLQNIDQGVFFVSLENDCTDVFQKISGTKHLSEQEKFPQNYTYKKQEIEINFIDTTQRFLQFQKDLNFLTPLYLLKKIKRVKFVLIFRQSQIKEIPIKSIKDTFIQFVNLFDKSIGSKLSQSCCVLIVNSALKVEAYHTIMFERGLLDNNYMHKQTNKNIIQQIGKSIKDNNRLIPWDGKTSFISSLVNILQDLKYLQISSNNIPEKNWQYQKYAEYQIHNYWKDIFEQLTKNLYQIITIQDSSHMAIIEDKLVSLFPYTQQKKQKKVSNQFLDISQFGKFVAKYIKIIIQVGYLLQKDKLAVLNIIKYLIEGNFITNKIVNQFFELYFSAHFYFSNGRNDNKDLIQQVQFRLMITHQKEDIERNIRLILNSFILQIQMHLENKQKMKNINYPYQSLQNSISIIIQAQKKQQIISSRIIKKLRKIDALLAFNEAKFIRTKNKRLKAQKWLNFLKKAHIMPLISFDNVKYAYKQLSQIFISSSYYPAAIKCLLQASEIENMREIKGIYEKQFKMIPQIIKYLSDSEFDKIKENLADYCNFMLKIGQSNQFTLFCFELLQKQLTQEEKKLVVNLIIKAKTKGNQMFQELLSRLVTNQNNTIRKDFLRYVENQISNFDI